MSYTWIVGYIFFVVVLIAVIYATVYATYVQLHADEDNRKEGFATQRCVTYTTDNVPLPWEDKTKWGDACTASDADSMVVAIEVLSNIGKVTKVSDIPASNAQRIYLPVGMVPSLRVEITKDKYDVYPQHIYVKKGFVATLTSLDDNVTKRYTEHAVISEDDQTKFKNAKVEVKAVIPEDEKTTDVENGTRDFVLKGKLKSKLNSNYCVTVKKNSKDVIASECTPDYKEQEWKRDEEGRIVSVANDTCLYVKDDNTIVQETCDKVPRQMWYTDSLHRMIAKNSPSMCMQPNGESVVEGASFVMKDCNKNLVQQWIL